VAIRPYAYMAIQPTAVGVVCHANRPGLTA